MIHQTRGPRGCKASTRAELEDHYLPFRPKRRTRAAMARERGLGPLAGVLLAAAGTGDTQFNPGAAARDYVDPEKDVSGVDEALAGARDVIAESASEDPEVRRRMRALYQREAVLRSRKVKGKEESGAKFRDYFDWKESVSRAPSHRVLALLRGDAEGVLRVTVEVPEEKALAIMEGHFVRGAGAAAQEARAALRDGFKRLLGPSMESEIRVEVKTRADEEAIRIFASNLTELLLAPPLGNRTVLAIDPGFRKEPRILSRRFSNSLRRVSWSRTAVICTSSRDPVASLRYRATKGTVAPPSSSLAAAAT